MSFPKIEETQRCLESHVRDEYQRHHALMVATAMEGYAQKLGEDPELWHATGLLHDVDYEEHPNEHPGPSLGWLKEWGYPDEMVHAVEAHAYGYNGFATLPQTRLAAALMACDELCGIFYAYKKMNPVPYGQIKASSIKKKFADPNFAAKIKREDIVRGVEALDVSLDEHIQNLIGFLTKLD